MRTQTFRNNVKGPSRQPRAHSSLPQPPPLASTRLLFQPTFVNCTEPARLQAFADPAASTERATSPGQIRAWPPLVLTSQLPPGLKRNEHPGFHNSPHLPDFLFLTGTYLSVTLIRL